ncbi:DUF1810 domain-containing protein [Melaminivora suipulveris]|uniref:DUF1810 domain-containing protein n=1 Tax=Melaminivora suipulveris TaxID=2109913 RepID=A0A2R3Q8H6_9BURK|nr:DUF1810 domain-containing protein [Melaminivora suipulveris]AVO48069.1 DUF1810 domain-containing protein [Melaminivora suipulveris]
MVSASHDPLQRFLKAQERDYDQALAELRAGHKRSHWIWYVLPQLRALGRSQTAQFYGLADAAEAAAYAAHPVLGARLAQCVRALLAHPDRSAEQMLGAVDAMKLRSCLTLFARVAPQQPVFAEALEQFFASRPDELTLRLLNQG